MYKPVKKQETLKFFNKSRKVSIDLIISEHTKKKNFTRKKVSLLKSNGILHEEKKQKQD